MKQIVKRSILGALLVLFFGLGSSYLSKAQSEGSVASPKKIAISQFVEHPALNETREGIIKELQEQGYVEGKNLEVLYDNAFGNIATSLQIAHRYANLPPEVVIIAISTLSAQTMMAALKEKPVEKKNPVVFASVSDPLRSKIVKSLEQPADHITGVSNAVPFKEQLAMMRQILPNLKKLGVIYNSGEANSVILVRYMKDVAAQSNLEIVEATVSKTSEVSAAAQRLVGNVEAIFINNDNTALAAFESITNVATLAKKPVFASDIQCVKRGALAVLGVDQRDDIGRQAGAMVVKIFNGAKTADLPVKFPQKTHLVLSKKMAKQLNMDFLETLIQHAKEIIE